jgi:hypothetical protein
VIEKKDLEFLKEIDDKFLAADAFCFILYGDDLERSGLFHHAFLTGIEADDTGTWIREEGIGPWALGYNLGAAWNSRR